MVKESKMENLDIIILSTIVTTLFIVFGFVTIKELRNVELSSKPSEEAGPRANMIRFVGRLFDESETKKMNPRQQAMVYSNVKRTIADMETDGVYFPKEVKDKLKKKREELICNYSDLPSVMSYLEEDDFYNGHS
jgi:hypothetical protein